MKLEFPVELAKTDYTNETELSAAREMVELRDAELVSLREELSQSKEDAATQRNFNNENVLLLDDIRLAFWRLHKDQIGAMISGEIAEQLKTNEMAFDISDHMDEIREDITYNFDISSFESEINEIVSEHDNTDEVTEIVEDVLRGAKITLG